MASTSSFYTIINDVYSAADHALRMVLNYVHTHTSSGEGGQLDHYNAMTSASLLDDDHPQYRLETADHTHASTGMQAGQLDHYNAMTSASLLDDDHTQYALRTIMTVDGDMIYRDAGLWARLPKGTALQNLRMNSAATAPEWSSAVAVVSSGSYSGNDTANRAIPHGLGVAPKMVVLTESSTADVIINHIFGGLAYIWAEGATISNRLAVTAPDATNFYVGNASDYTQSANSATASRTYKWVAIG